MEMPEALLHSASEGRRHEDYLITWEMGLSYLNFNFIYLLTLFLIKLHLICDLGQGRNIGYRELKVQMKEKKYYSRI